MNAINKRSLFLGFLLVSTLILLTGCTPFKTIKDTITTSPTEAEINHEEIFKEKYSKAHLHIFDIYEKSIKKLTFPQIYQYDAKVDINFNSQEKGNKNISLTSIGQGTSIPPTTIEEIELSNNTSIDFQGSVENPLGGFINSINSHVDLKIKSGNIFFSLLSGGIKDESNKDAISLTPLVGKSYLIPIEELLIKMGVLNEDVNTYFNTISQRFKLQQQLQSLWKESSFLKFTDFVEDTDGHTAYKVILNKPSIEKIINSINESNSPSQKPINLEDIQFEGTIRFDNNNPENFILSGNLSNNETNKKTKIDITYNDTIFKVEFYDNNKNQLILAGEKSDTHFKIHIPQNFSISAEKIGEEYIGSITDLQSSEVINSFALTFNENGISGNIQIPNSGIHIEITSLIFDLKNTTNSDLIIKTPLGEMKVDISFDIKEKDSLDIEIPNEGENINSFLNSIMEISLETLSRGSTL